MSEVNHIKQGGLRLQGTIKKHTSNLPLVSIITVVFNGELELEETIKSVINQSYNNIEYI
ncbi:MAG: glycosyltransferase, partial [Cyanobacteria bacterium P01_F01_bin.143]